MSNGKSEMRKFGERWKTSIKKEKSVLLELVISFPIIWMPCLKQQKILPAVNQVRLAPGVFQEEVVDYCREEGILLEAWGPFGQGELFDSKQVQEIAENHGKSVAQIALAWSLAEGFLPLPKSVTASRIQANLDCFGIELSHEERETLKVIAVQSGAPRVDDMDF